MKEQSGSSASSAVADKGGNMNSGGSINGTNGTNGNSTGAAAPRAGRPHDLVRVSSVDAGRDLTSAYGSSYDDVMDGESTSGEDGNGGLVEAERRRLGVEQPTTSTAPTVKENCAKSTAVGGAVKGSVRDQLIGVQHPPHLVSSSTSQQRQQQQSQHSSRSNHSSASNSVASSSAAQRRRGSLRRNRHRRRDSYDGEDDFSGSDGESSYFSEHQASPKSSSTTPTAATMAAAAAAAAKQHASGMPSARPVTMCAASNANVNAIALPQVPSLGLPYLSHQQQLAGTSMDNLDTSLSFSDDEEDNDVGNGGNTTRLGGIPSQQPRPHHNVPRLHRRSSSDEQLQLYTRTVERGTSAQSVSSIVSSSSDEAAGPEPAIYNAGPGSRGAPPSVSIPTIPRGAASGRGNARIPRDPSETANNIDGSRQHRYTQASSASADASMDDSTVFSSSATSPSSEFTSSTSSDPSVRSELREIGVQGGFEGAEGGRSSGRRKPFKDVDEITGATPSSMDGRQQASSRQLQPPHISTSSEGAQATAAHPRAERIPLASQDQMAQTWISMASVPTKSPSSPGGAHSPSRRAATDRSGSVLSSTASRTTSLSDGGHSHYFTSQPSHPSGATLNMHYSEDDDTAGGGGFSRQVGHAGGNNRGRNGEMNLSEDAQRGNRRAMFADSKISNASGKERPMEGAEGDVVAGGFRVYWRRWLMLMYMSLLNLLSDWTCYSVAPIAVLTSEAFGAIDPESLVTIFLSANAVASGLEPIILGRLGLRRTVVFGSLLLMLGSIVKSGGLPLLMPR